MKEQTLHVVFDPKRNSIGFIRLMSAILVIIGHLIPFGGFGIDPLINLSNNQIAIGRIPVDIFFALSGYLIAASYFRSDCFLIFIWQL